MRPLIEQAVGRGVRVELHSVEDVPPVRMDPTQLRQVILNLAGNARDAMPDGGEFSIEVSTIDGATTAAVPARTVVISVHDSGTGIPKSIRDRIFEPFFTTKSMEQGTGLGLAISFASIRTAGGHLSLREDGRRGTTLRIELPADAGRGDV